MTGSREEAQDLAQRTFVKAHEALPRFRFDCPLRNWLLRIAVRECLHWRRDERPTLLLDETLPARERNRESLLLHEALATLPADIRDPFLLRHVEGLSTRETADLLGIPEGTVKSRGHAARLRLRAALDPGSADSSPHQDPGLQSGGEPAHENP